jgi:ABC-type multidrug transport system fused ATPase/permease subunit
MSLLIREFLKRNFSSLAFYFRYLRYKIFLLVIASVLVGVLDGFGLALFIPLLQLVADPNQVIHPTSMGNLGFLVKAFGILGVPITLLSVLVALSIFFTFKGVAKWAEQYLRIIYYRLLIKKTRFYLLNRIVGLKYTHFVNSKMGELQNAMTVETSRLAQSFNSYSQMLQNLVLLVTYLFLAFVANPKFAFMVLLFGGLTNFIFRFFYFKTKSYSKDLVEETNHYQSLVIQFFGNFKYLKATSGVSKFGSRLEKQILEIEETNKKIGNLDSLSTGLREPIMIYVLVLVISIQTMFIGGGVESVMVSLLFLYRGLSSIALLQSSYNKYLSFHGSLSNYQKVIEELSNNQEVVGTNQPSDIYDIKLDNISYSYGSNLVLQNISIDIRSRKVFGILGESGSGKTTLINLIAGIIYPDSGSVFVNNVDLKQLDLASYKRKIGYVTQEPIIFEDTLFNNITLWDEFNEANFNRFLTALKKAHISDLFERAPEKERVMLGIAGLNLSGGQRQRISIARELYKNIDLLLLDEATSALDDETELIIRQSIEELKGHVTMIIIAHRKATLHMADYLIKLENGRIVSKDIGSSLIN